MSEQFITDFLLVSVVLQMYAQWPVATLIALAATGPVVVLTRRRDRGLEAVAIRPTPDPDPGVNSAALQLDAARPVTVATTGRPRTYCSRSCQQSAYRGRPAS